MREQNDTPIAFINHNVDVLQKWLNRSRLLNLKVN